MGANRTMITVRGSLQAGLIRNWLLTLFAVLLLPTLATLAGAQGTPRQGGRIIHGLEGEPTTTNPLLDTGAETGTLAMHIFDALLEQDIDFNIKPRLAEKWQVSSDGKTYTFWLYKNAAWHDGKPVTSEDVKWSLETAADVHPRMGRTLKGLIDRVDTPDRQTVVLRLKEPFAPLLGLLATEPAANVMIMPKHVYGDGQDLKRHPANQKPVGSGPYKIKQWVRGSHIELERNVNYHRAPKPYLDTVILQFLPDASSRWLALEKGEVDFLSYFMVPLEQVAKAKANPNLIVDERGGEGGGTLVNLIMNNRTEWFSKREVRHAMAHAIDRKVLINTAFQGLGKPAVSILHSGLRPMFTSEVPEYPYDIGKANSLLDAAGYPRKADGTRFKIRLVWATGREYETPVAEVLRSQLRQVGVDVELQKLDRAAAIDRVYIKWDFDAVIWSLTTGPDPTVGVTRSYHTKRIDKVPFANASGYSNPEADKLFDVEYLRPVEKERVAIWYRIQRMVMTDLPSYPLVELPIANVYRKGYRNVISHPAQASRYLGEAWMESPPPR